VFLDLLQDRILPQVRQQVALDATQLSLWGHSYGGLFVLHACSPGRACSAVISRPVPRCGGRVV
jgi:predicted alpha/beta superfamily hydrolase